jgi:RNA polymerase sigma-70 factor (ECF subfamily)
MPLPAIDTDDLIRYLTLAGQGDARAFRILHARCARPLLARALRIVRSSEAAEDVLQESFMAIWRDARRFDPSRAAPMTWMATIVRNKAIDFLRANRCRAMAAEDESQLLADAAAGPCEAAELQQHARLVGEGLSGLKEIHREAIELSYFHELTHGQIATHMAIPLGTVKTWIRRGCKQMRRQLEGSGQVRAHHW